MWEDWLKRLTISGEKVLPVNGLKSAKMSWGRWGGGVQKRKQVYMNERKAARICMRLLNSTEVHTELQTLPESPTRALSRALIRACTQRIYTGLGERHKKRLHKPWAVLTKVSNNAYPWKPDWKKPHNSQGIKQSTQKGLTSVVRTKTAVCFHLRNLKSKTQKYQMIPHET